MIYKIYKYLLNKIVNKHFSIRILSTASVEEKFTWIYNNNFWRSNESSSGTGSTLEYTSNIRDKLPAILKKYGVIRMIDAPCGDFNWMKEVLKEVEVQYIGCDIVESLVSRNITNFEKENVKFIRINLITDVPPEGDIMFCRDCLFHLSFSDTRKVLENFLKSKSSYLLTTTFVNENKFINRDIKTGDFRLIDLFSSPYNFPRECLETIDDWMAPDPERVMCLWSRNQISDALGKFSLSN